MAIKSEITVSVEKDRIVLRLTNDKVAGRELATFPNASFQRMFAVQTAFNMGKALSVDAVTFAVWQEDFDKLKPLVLAIVGLEAFGNPTMTKYGFPAFKPGAVTLTVEA